MQNQEIIINRKAYYSVGMASELSPHGTGANLELEVRLKGSLDPSTDLVVNLTDVQSSLDKLKLLIDHKHFQFDVVDFTGNPASKKDIAQFCWDKLKGFMAFDQAWMVELAVQFNVDEEIILSDK